MFSCYEDGDLGWVLTSDPDVTCNTGPTRSILLVHVYLICGVIGVGLPGEQVHERKLEEKKDFLTHSISVTIFWQTRRLRDNDMLTADSPLASVFEYYTPSVPYFESVHLLRKGLLILFISILSDPISQSAGNLAVNVLFLVILELKQVNKICLKYIAK